MKITYCTVFHSITLLKCIAYNKKVLSTPLTYQISRIDPELVVDCINTHAPLRKVKLTRPVVPWMNDTKIVNLRKDLDTQRTVYRNQKSSSNHANYENTRNKLSSSTYT